MLNNFIFPNLFRIFIAFPLFFKFHSLFRLVFKFIQGDVNLSKKRLFGVVNY